MSRLAYVRTYIYLNKMSYTPVKFRIYSSNNLHLYLLNKYRRTFVKLASEVGVFSDKWLEEIIDLCLAYHELRILDQTRSRTTVTIKANENAENDEEKIESTAEIYVSNYNSPERVEVYMSFIGANGIHLHPKRLKDKEISINRYLTYGGFLSLIRDEYSRIIKDLIPELNREVVKALISEMASRRVEEHKLSAFLHQHNTYSVFDWPTQEKIDLVHEQIRDLARNIALGMRSKINVLMNMRVTEKMSPPKRKRIIIGGRL